MSETRVYVQDDYGEHWFYDPSTSCIRCVGSDVDSSQDGYYCIDLEDGIRLLIEYGYITPPEGLS